MPIKVKFSPFGILIKSALPSKDTLENTSWVDISKVSAAGQGANYWNIGDTKSVHLQGTVGTLALDTTLYVYILGFDHNWEVEGKGITFGCFKTAQIGGIDVCLTDASYNTNKRNGSKVFNLNHWGGFSSPYNTNYGGWAACDARYDILGSTDKAPTPYGSTKTTSATGQDPSATCAINPVARTLMAAFPADLRAVMKPITKWTDNKGNSSNTADHVTSTIDYLPLLAEWEVYGERNYANENEKNHQVQYAYYSAGNAKIKYRHDNTGTAANWWERSPRYNTTTSFCYVYTNGGATGSYSYTSGGLAPAFMV